MPFHTEAKKAAEELSKAQHTPGPWKLGAHSMSAVFAGKRLVASCAGYSSTEQQEQVHLENEANARLIAAAPELLDALIIAHHIISGDKDNHLTDYAFISAAIAKVRNP